MNRPFSLRPTITWSENRSDRLASVPLELCCFVVGLLLLVFPTSAAAQSSGWYGGGTLSRSYLGTDNVTLTNTAFGSGEFAADFEEALSFGAVGGYRWSNGLRLEGEYLYRTSDVSRINVVDLEIGDGDFSSVALSANLYYDFLRNSRWTPYVGLGASWIQEVDIDFEDGENERSYESDGDALQFMAGLWFDVGSRWSLDLQLRTMDAGDVVMDSEEALGSVAAEYTPVNLQLGVYYRF